MALGGTGRGFGGEWAGLVADKGSHITDQAPHIKDCGLKKKIKPLSLGQRTSSRLQVESGRSLQLRVVKVGEGFFFHITFVSFSLIAAEVLLAPSGASQRPLPREWAGSTCP